VRVLASFQVVDETTGEQSYLSGTRDQLFDVSILVIKLLTEFLGHASGHGTDSSYR
jgi:hypothetical protein